MSRFNQKQYQWRIGVAMFIYVAVMLLVWPLARHTPDLFLKTLLACVPVLPMFYVIGLMAWRVWQSDELEQRTHLIALGVATVLVATLSLVGGFLAAAQVLPLDGSILIWVFPVMLIGYDIARWWVATRRYGSASSCDEAGTGVPRGFLMIGALMGMIALAAWWRGRMGPMSLGMLAGMALVLVVVGLIRLVRALRRRALSGDE